MFDVDFRRPLTSWNEVRPELKGVMTQVRDTLLGNIWWNGRKRKLAEPAAAGMDII